ncbi:MAG: hypothetical protein J7K15_03885 [Deltaproteobacteria bacterium]|nr:hypothetical protein [Deltaproteobacteria bacterium]
MEDRVLTTSEPHSARRGNHEPRDTTAVEISSEQTVRCAYRVAGVSRGHIKPVETSRTNRKVRKTHPGEGLNGATCRMAGVNESGK